MWWKNFLAKRVGQPVYLETAEQRLNSSSRAIEEIVREASASISEFRRAHNKVAEYVTDRDDEDDAQEEAKAAAEKLRTPGLGKL